MRKLLEILPLATIICIGFGYLNIQFYYNQFGINIYPYLQPTEILFSFAPILLSITILIIAIYLTIIASELYQKRKRSNKKSSKLRSIEGLYPKLESKSFFLLTFCASAIVGIVLYPKLFIVLPELFSDFILFLSIVAPMGLIPSVVYFDAITRYIIKKNFSRVNENEETIYVGEKVTYKNELSIRKKIENDINKMKYIFVVLPFIIAFIISLYFRSYVKYDKLMEGKYSSFGNFFYDAHLTLNDGRIVRTSNNLIFIGSTQNYIFLLNKSARTNVIIPIAQIAEIRLKEIKSR